MPLDLQIIHAHEFIRMGPQGKLDLVASRAVLETLASACRKRGIERALLDVRDVRTDFGLEELAALVQMFREIGFPSGQRLALLHSGDPNRRARLLAFIGTLRGWAVRAFGDFEAALEWLALSEGAESAESPAAGDQIQIPLKLAPPPAPPSPH